jgi:hypothetical protein
MTPSLVVVVRRDDPVVDDGRWLAGYILGEYTEENCPRYLKKENFARMKAYLKAGKLHLFHGSIEQAIIKNGEDNDELFTVASLLVRHTLEGTLLIMITGDSLLDHQASLSPKDNVIEEPHPESRW